MANAFLNELMPNALRYPPGTAFLDMKWTRHLPPALTKTIGTLAADLAANPPAAQSMSATFIQHLDLEPAVTNTIGSESSLGSRSSALNLDSNRPIDDNYPHLINFVHAGGRTYVPQMTIADSLSRGNRGASPTRSTSTSSNSDSTSPKNSAPRSPKWTDYDTANDDGSHNAGSDSDSDSGSDGHIYAPPPWISDANAALARSMTPLHTGNEHHVIKIHSL